MGIAFMSITTIINVILILTVQLDLIHVFIILGISAIGYSISNAYLDSYLHRHEMHHYTKGYEHGIDHGKEIQQYKNIH